MLIIAAATLLIHLASGTNIDDNGYVVYCPCMGRFGNQVEHFLGSFNFAKSLNRTLVLPPFIEYRPGQPKATMVPFDSLFDVSTLELFHRVVAMEKFMIHIADTVWPKQKRKVLCWSPRESVYDKGAEKGCHAKEGNPFGPFWDYSSVEFVGDMYYGSLETGYDVSSSEGIDEWTARFPPSKYPVLAFAGAPASFPVDQLNRFLQKYLKWKPSVGDRAARFIKKYLPRRFIGIHLRNNVDWDNVCEHVGGHNQLFASAQCLGYGNEHGQLTREICKPSSELVLDEVEEKVRSLNAQSVFVSSDKDHMIEALDERMQPYNVTVHRLDPDDPFVSLAILGKADHFIGNCVSTFSAFVRRIPENSRHREFQERFYKSTSFFGFSPRRPKIEL